MISQFQAHKTLKEDLGTIIDSPIGDVWEYLKMQQSTVVLLWGNSSPLAGFSCNGISIWKNKLSLPFQLQENIADRNFSIQQILSMLDTDDISLNHLGVRYQVENIDSEVERIRKAFSNDVYKVFEDTEGHKENMRWLFVWVEDTKNPGKPQIDIPMFEIVLPDPKENIAPHFQFDVDTLLSPEEIEVKISRWMRLKDNTDPFNWHLDIPERVVSMGTYYNQGGLQLDMGIGTNKRSRKDHRESMVKLT